MDNRKPVPNMNDRKPVLFELLSKYEETRIEDRKKFGKVIKTNAERFIKFFSGAELNEVIIKKMQKKITEAIELAQKDEDWINLAIKLGDKAKIAQGLRSEDGSVPSFFCETLHALRSYIIHSLKSQENHQSLTDKIAKLRKEKKDTSAEIKTSSIKKLGKLREKQNRSIIELAFLEDKESMENAMKRSLFSYLGKINPEDKSLPVKSLNPAFPLSLQCGELKTFEIIYNILYPNSFISFDKFEDSLIKKLSPTLKNIAT